MNEAENTLIFAYGFGITTPFPDRFMKIIKERDGKPMHFYEIEAALALDSNVKSEDLRSCLGIQYWEDPLSLKCPLSGPLILLTTDPLITNGILPFVAEGHCIQFHSLRAVIWTNSGGRYWLDLEIKWDVNKFIGILNVLNHRMQPCNIF